MKYLLEFQETYANCFLLLNSNLLSNNDNVHEDGTLHTFLFDSQLLSLDSEYVFAIDFFQYI